MEHRKVKCLVWDLDCTLWEGTLLEDSQVLLNENAVNVIRELDRRGIINSIASKNYYDNTMKVLEKHGIAEYFLYPQINWEAKSTSIETIASKLNINIDSFAFIDDQQYELSEVKYAHPEVMVLSADVIDKILDMPEFQPDFITEDSSLRRKMYQDEMKRTILESEFKGPKEDFLKTLNMVFTVKKACEEDLARVQELTVRTHQLNTTGYTYSFDELKGFITDSRHILLVAELQDDLGSYGKIGLALLECKGDDWIIKLFLMSCRVMARGVGSVLLTYLINLAKESGKNLFAEFISNERNRMMYITYKMSGFSEVDEKDGKSLLKCDLGKKYIQPFYIKMEV